MKHTKLTTAVMALAAAAVLATSARAADTFYSSGDLLLGFELSGNANNYLVDLGQASQFVNASSPLQFSLSTADLSSIFGSSWASNSATSLVQWGVVGNDQSAAVQASPATIWYTKGEVTAGTLTTPPIRGTVSALNSVSSTIQNLETGLGGYDGNVSTANSTHAVIQSSSADNSWSSFSPGTGTAFGIGTSVEQPLTGSATGPTNSVLDLFQVSPKTASNQPATLLGEFSLGSGGVLTFTPAQSVPEPASYALGITAILLFVVLKRRNSLSSAV